MKNRDIILIVGAVAFILLIVSLSLLIGNQLKPQACGCPKVISQNFIWLFTLLAIVFVGSITYYLLSLRIDAQKRLIEKNIEIIYTILDEDEKKVLKKIISNKGQVNQIELLGEFDKIKVHRVIRKLVEKKIIDVEKNGKENRIKLKEELMQELL
jgi:uncharacterized membrane protein